MPAAISWYWRLGGEILKVSASGDTVPGFEATLDVPQPIRVTSPSPDADGLIQALPSEDLVLKFAPVRSLAKLEVSSWSQAKHLACSADAVASELRIPAAALDAIGYPQTLMLKTRQVQSLVVEDWRIDLAVTLELKAGDTVITGIVVE
jgi:hypothetical protein